MNQPLEGFAINYRQPATLDTHPARPPESSQGYVLCYQCHNRSYLLGDQAGTFPHRRHVEDSQASCATCHDAHGSRDHQGLINFMVRDSTGNTVVSPSASGRMEYVPLGAGRGACYLQCHGADHEGWEYP